MSSAQLVISMSNSGRAWDNSKKYISAGGLGKEYGLRMALADLAALAAAMSDRVHMEASREDVVHSEASHCLRLRTLLKVAPQRRNSMTSLSIASSQPIFCSTPCRATCMCSCPLQG